MRGFRALSLDLWFTTITYGPDSDRLWTESRLRTLSDMIRSPMGTRFTSEQLQTAMEVVQRDSPRVRGPTGILNPSSYVEKVAEYLGVQLTVPAREAGLRFSAAGLAEHPPGINPEAVAVLQEMQRRGIPVLSITNTARLEETWRTFFRERGAPAFHTIVTSCEAGAWKPDPRIFEAAAERLTIPPSEILHVGDRWDLDVMGARSAGCGAALYRGLWPLYPPGEAGDAQVPEPVPDGVLVIERLDEVLDPKLWSATADSGR
jgi:HAD superfamily hydrolase (TIGR01509 family)